MLGQREKWLCTGLSRLSQGLECLQERISQIWICRIRGDKNGPMLEGFCNTESFFLSKPVPQQGLTPKNAGLDVEACRL